MLQRENPVNRSSYKKGMIERVRVRQGTRRQRSSERGVSERRGMVASIPQSGGRLCVLAEIIMDLAPSSIGSRLGINQNRAFQIQPYLAT